MARTKRKKKSQFPQVEVEIPAKKTNPDENTDQGALLILQKLMREVKAKAGFTFEVPKRRNDFHIAVASTMEETDGEK